MTAEQIKAEFRREGRTLKEFADRHGFRPNDVTRVLNGALKGHRGRAHDIAVAIGLKKVA